MKQQFIETIKIKNGKALALPYHQARMERTIRRFFPTLASEEIKLSSLISPKEEMNLYKARVVYGTQGVEAIEYAPYKMKEIHSLKVVEDDVYYLYNMYYILNFNTYISEFIYNCTLVSSCFY